MRKLLVTRFTRLAIFLYLGILYFDNSFKCGDFACYIQGWQED
jgi:hypothetical protein